MKQKLAPYKYPRWIEIRSELPKTATGKIQRFKLRAEGRANSCHTGRETVREQVHPCRKGMSGKRAWR